MTQKIGRKASRTQSRATSKAAKTSAAKRVSRPRKTEEQTLQMIAVQWFRNAYPRVLAFHVPNGGLRNRKVAETLQRMGVLPGVYDWLMFPGLAKVAIEFKKLGGVLSDEQKDFMVAWIACGGRCASVTTLEQFKEVCLMFCGPSFVELGNQNPVPGNLGVDERIGAIGNS